MIKMGGFKPEVDEFVDEFTAIKKIWINGCTGYQIPKTLAKYFQLTRCLNGRPYHIERNEQVFMEALEHMFYIALVGMRKTQLENELINLKIELKELEKMNDKYKTARIKIIKTMIKAAEKILEK